MKFKEANTHTIQCMGQDISLKRERNLNHDLTFSAHTINCQYKVNVKSTWYIYIIGGHTFHEDYKEYKKKKMDVIWPLEWRDLDIRWK